MEIMEDDLIDGLCWTTYTDPLTPHLPLHLTLIATHIG